MDKKITKFIIFSVFIILAVLIYVLFFFNSKEAPIIKKDINTVIDTEIVEILKKDNNILEYTQKYPDFKIEDKEILTKDSILAGQNGQNLQPLYYGLELEDSRYMKVQLMDLSGSNGFFGVIDFKDSSVEKAFGILLFQASAGVGGESVEVTTPK